MGILIDIVLVTIVVLSALRGYKSGLMLGLCGILAVIISLYGANLISTVYSHEYAGVLKPFVSGMVDASISDTVKNSEENEVILVEGTSENDTEVYAISFSALKDLGLSDSAARLIAEEVDFKTADAGQVISISNTITNKLCANLAFLAVFSIVFLLLIIFFAVIGNLVNLTFAIPGHEYIDHYSGMVLGIMRGIIFILVIACIFRYAGLLALGDAIEDTFLMKWLMNSNIIANIIGI